MLYNLLRNILRAQEKCEKYFPENEQNINVFFNCFANNFHMIRDVKQRVLEIRRQRM